MTAIDAVVIIPLDRRPLMHKQWKWTNQWGLVTTIAALLGISSSINPGESCPSASENGPMHANQRSSVLILSCRIHSADPISDYGELNRK